MSALGISFGDIATAISLVYTVYDALKASSGASADFRALMHELRTIEQALLSVKNLAIEESTPNHAAAKEAILGCQTCITEFLCSVDKYQPLSAGKTSLKGQILKVKWSLCHKGDVTKFRNDLGTWISALNLVVSVEGAKTGVHTSNMLKEHDELLGNVQKAIQQQASEQQILLQKFEERLKISADSITTARQTKFEVKPLRLIGAPATLDFVDRPLVIQQIEDALLPIQTSQQTITVCCGMGGIGKSQLAKRYAETHLQYTATFWINASSRRSLDVGIAKIAERIPLPLLLDSNGRIGTDDVSIHRAREAVENWLDQEGNSSWLLILDNLDGEESRERDCQSEDVYDFSQYLPATSQGSVLISSRLGSLADQVGGKAIEVVEMTSGEGLDLLSRASHKPPSEPGLGIIVTRLGAHPLALSQAGRLMRKTLMSPSKYVAQYDDRMQTLMKARPGLREYHHGSIAATLELSFDQLAHQNPSAAAFLLLCGFLDNFALSFPLFHASTQSDDLADDEDFMTELDKLPIANLPQGWMSRLCEHENAYLEVIESLHDFSFVRQSLDRDNDDVVSIHPLIHQWSIEYVRAFGGAVYIMAAVASIMANSTPRTSHYSKGLPYHQIQPHYDHWYSLFKADSALAARVGCKSAWKLIEFRFSQAVSDETIPLVHIAADNALARHGWSHDHTIILQLILSGTYRRSSQTFQKGVDLLEKLVPYALETRFMPEISAEDDRAMVECSLGYCRFLMIEPREPQNALSACGCSDNQDLASNILRRCEEICDSSRNLYVYPYLHWLRFVIRRQRPGYQYPDTTDEDVEMIQRVLEMLEHGILGRHSFSPAPYFIRVLQARLLLYRGEASQASHAMEGLFNRVLTAEGPSSLALLQIGDIIMATGPSYFFNIFLNDANVARHWGAALDLAHIRLLWQYRQDGGRSRTFGQGDPERSFQAFRRWQMLLARVREVVRRSREARAKSAT